MYANEYMITLRHLFVEFVSPLGKSYDQDEEGESLRKQFLLPLSLLMT